MSIASAWLAPGIGFLLALASGVVLGRLGKPLNTAVFTVHKLIALAAVILTGARVYGSLVNAPVPLITGLLIVVSGLCALALFATGAVMSISRFNSAVAVRIHRILPVMATLAMATTIYLLEGNKL